MREKVSRFLLIWTILFGYVQLDDFTCPAADELNSCICTESIRQLRCPPGSRPLTLKKAYTFTSVLIQNGDDIGNFFEKVRHNYLLTESLIIQNFSAKPGDEGEFAQNDLETVMQIVQKSLRIDGINMPLLDAYNLQHETLTELHITGMKLKNMDFQGLKSLKNLQLDKSDFPADIIQFDATSLDQIKVTEAPNLRVVKIKADNCKPDNRIHIFLRQNPKLELFNFDALKLSSPDCKYNIDLSGNTNFNKSWLKDNQKLIQKSAKNQLYIVMQDDLQVCTRCLLKIATETHKGSLHSVQCSEPSAVRDKYLIDVHVNDLDPEKEGEC